MPPDQEIPVVHLLQVLIRQNRGSTVVFLLHPHPSWRPADGQETHLVLPTRKTIADLNEPVLRGTSLEAFLREELVGEHSLAANEYVVEEELGSTEVVMPSLGEKVMKKFVLCPVDIWVDPVRREDVRSRLEGVWLTPAEALAHPRISPSARQVFTHVLEREERLRAQYEKNPAEEAKDETPNRLLLKPVPDRPSMYALANRWFADNKSGVRHLPAGVIREVLDSGTRAFNLRVADPYLRYQRQGIGFTWSFFTEKDGQDIHVHGAPSVEIYGVIEGELEVWWKPYHDQGTAAWSRQTVGPGGWIEVEALHCHAVRWKGKGMGVVFKAGPGPLAGVGRLGVAGKTKCDGCVCTKPAEVCAFEKK